MALHRRIEITIETDRILTIRRKDCARRWCPICGCDVYVVQAEILNSMGQPTLDDGNAVEEWHCFEGPDGKLLICLKSLLKST
jgi:hypothetical protein